MKNILVISGHPELTHSVANATILDEVETALPDVEIRRLDRLYPDGKFNIAAEQKSLLRADVIVWQFPFSWYGLPGLMKKWLDEVFVHGFAHGSTAKLGGKKLILSFTTGAPEELYTVDSFFGHTIEEYLMSVLIANISMPPHTKHSLLVHLTLLTGRRKLPWSHSFWATNTSYRMNELSIIW